MRLAPVSVLPHVSFFCAPRCPSTLTRCVQLRWLAGARPVARAFGNTQWPRHEVVFEFPVGHRVLERKDPAAHGDAGGVHAVAIIRDERMPPIEIAALGNQPIPT